MTMLNGDNVTALRWHVGRKDPFGGSLPDYAGLGEQSARALVIGQQQA